MPKLLAFWILFYTACLGWWIYRSIRAYQSLRAMPVLIPTGYPFGISDPPKVSVIIPAKNEELNIRDCIESLLHQDYPHFEIIAINDSSSDNTEQILEKLAAQHPQRFRYINAQATPDGWTGKNFALHSAIEYARGDWFLFTDADTRHETDSVSSSLYYALERKINFLTLLPHCLTKGFFENLIQPIAMSAIGLWFPMQKVNDPNSAVHFANGQYILIKRDLYESAKGHLGVSGEFLEDFALMKNVKSVNGSAQCALGSSVYGTRMYQSLDSSWKGWRRIYLHAFKKNLWKLSGRIISLFLFSVAPFVVFAIAGPFFLMRPSWEGWIALAISIPVFVMALTPCWIAYGRIKANKFFVFLHPLAVFFLTMILADALRVKILDHKTVWR